MYYNCSLHPIVRVWYGVMKAETWSYGVIIIQTVDCTIFYNYIENSSTIII